MRNSTKHLPWVLAALHSAAFYSIAVAGRAAAVVASSSGEELLASEPESSTLLTRLSYRDLLEVFGDAEDPPGTDDLANTLAQSSDKLFPLLRTIEQAFGKAEPSLGFLEVTGLPPFVVDLRRRLLPRASELANLPPDELVALERPETGYSIGWSHGRESFRVESTEDGENPTTSGRVAIQRRYDTAKGSFYMNPFANSDAGIENVYPPSLQPQLEDELLRMTKFMSKVGLWIAALCDLYLHESTRMNTDRPGEQHACEFRDEAESCSGADLDVALSISANPWMVYNSLKHGKPAAKARLLYYFPREQQAEPRKPGESEEESNQRKQEDVFDDWCGWHTDHGTLTALLPGMLCEDTVQNGAEPAKAFPPAHPKPGLYIKTSIPTAAGGFLPDATQQNNGPGREQLVHVDLAPDSLGFQLGETLQILSRGKFVATPHAVKAPQNARSVGRASLAVFLQPLASQVLPPLVAGDGGGGGGDPRDDGGDGLSLQSRWRSTFGEFQRVTIESFS